MRRLLLMSLALAACARGGPAGGDGGPAVDGGAVADGASAADADTCPAAPCSLLDQCGCESSSQVCDLDRDQLASGTTECRDVTTPGTEQANCETTTECAAGFGCLGVTDFMQCRRYCDDDGDCGDGAHCVIPVTYVDGNGDTQPVPGAVACSKSCTIEAASDNGCPDDPQFGCRMLWENPNDSADPDGDEYFLSDCGRAPASGGGDDAACTTHANCKPGFGCLAFPGGSHKCKQYCVYNLDGAAGPRACAAGSCGQFSDNPMIGSTEYGYCD